jgi:hypothetical protein
MLASAHYYFDTVYAAVNGPGMTTVIGLIFYVAAWGLVLTLASMHD